MLWWFTSICIGRFDLSDLGFRSKGWVGDIAAVAMIGSLGLFKGLATQNVVEPSIVTALSATLFRMFGNPASSVENLFYFGFLTNRISKQYNRRLVPFLIGAMYTAHEVSNPEY